MVKARLFYERRTEAMEDWVQGLARSTKVQIFEDRLNGVSATAQANAKAPLP